MWSLFVRSKPARLAITASDLHSAIVAQLGSHMAGNCTVRLADALYTSVTPEEAQAFIDASATFWMPDINDCDDQAWMAKAAAIKQQNKERHPLAFGVVWTEDHALNWYLDPTSRVRLIDQPGASNKLMPITLVLG